MSKLSEMRLSALQVALLKIMISAKGPVSLDVLERSVYHKAGKKKSQSAPRKSLAGIIRYTTEQKLSRLRCRIERRTTLGSGRRAVYELFGNIDALKECIAWNLDRRNL